MMLNELEVTSVPVPQWRGHWHIDIDFPATTYFYLILDPVTLSLSKDYNEGSAVTV